MKLLKTLIRKIKKNFRSKIKFANNKFYSCNICGWNGRNFKSDKWHKYSTCPNCESDVRHRLFVACLEHTKDIGIEFSLKGKKVLHFAPETLISNLMPNLTTTYNTADFIRDDCDIKLDMCDMKEVSSSSFDVLIAFDVLEHVPNFRTALKEINRILIDNIGIAVLSVPQRDNLIKTYEDFSITEPKDREKTFGQWDHLRIFGDDFADEVTKQGFQVLEISWKSFNDIVASKYMLKHPIPSSDINATNNRRIYICRKNKKR